MVPARACEAAFESGMNFGRSGLRIRRTAVDVEKLPRGQHDLRIDIECRDVRVIAKPVIDPLHRIGIGSLPAGQRVVIGHGGRREPACQRVDQRPCRFRRSAGSRARRADSSMTGLQCLYLLFPGEPLPGHVHERAAGDGDSPPGNGKAVLEIGRGAETVRGFLVIEAIEPGKPARTPSCHFMLGLDEGRTAVWQIERIGLWNRTHDAKLMHHRGIWKAVSALAGWRAQAA